MTFIRYLNSIKFAPRCVDCKHYIMTELITGLNARENMYATAKCSKTIYKCADTGQYKYEYAYIVRSEEKMCGPNGNYFLPLIKKEN